MKRVVLCELMVMLLLGLSVCISSEAEADVVAAWLFDEGGGTVVNDSSGNDLTGTIRGNPQWLPEGEAVFGSALRFADGDCVDFGPPTPPALMVQQDISFTVWCKPHQIVNHWQVLFSMQRGSSGGEAYAMTYGSNDDQLRPILDTTGGTANFTDPTPLVMDEWVHAAVTYDGRTVILYRNGEPVAQNSTSASGALDHENGQGRFAINGNYNSLNGDLKEHAVCSLDEVVIFDEVLTQGQIRGIMEVGFQEWYVGPAFARHPAPKNGESDVLCDVTLSWTAGDFAKTHDVYVGASLEAVEAAGPANTADMLFTSLGQNGTTYDFATPLEFGKTYYWRVDEVNGPPDSTVFKGSVWSFEVEPQAYPLAGIVATASSATSGMEPGKTVDDSGLTGLTHSTVDTEMWLSAGGVGMTLPAWIQYELPRTCKLHEMRVWNSNQTMESGFGIGAKDVTIQYSLDGVEWTTLRNQQFQQAPGNDAYEGELVPLDGVSAKFVRLEIASNWGGILQQAGLSEVQFFHIPVRARYPQPASGATGVAVDSVLSWRAGREAVTHEVCLSTDQQAVLDGTAPVQVATESRITPSTLEYGQTYYWKVDEVGTESTWQGELWNFTTPDYEIVDDMESYKDVEPMEIWATWLDGTEFGTNDPTNGSIVGADPAANDYGAAPGRNAGQSLPIWINNSATAPKSEATRTFQPGRDWTAHGLKSLSLWFRGAPDNSGQLYVKINDTKVPYSGDAADIKNTQWQVFNIDLSTVTATLSNVTKLSVGVEGAGATGVIYIDDIRLYPDTPAFITPADPGKTGLLAEYLFENEATDTSGNGHHGTLLDNAYTLNSVLVLDGTDDAVAIPRIGGATATFTSCTYSMWMFSNVALATAGPRGGINFNDWSAGGIHCKLYNGKANAGINGLQGNDMNGTTVVGAQEWVHLALTVVNDKATLYLNGKAEASRTSTKPLNMILGSGCIGAWNKAGDIQRELNGQMDDVRIYDRALSPEEILWLAGKRAPVHRPF